MVTKDFLIANGFQSIFPASIIMGSLEYSLRGDRYLCYCNAGTRWEMLYICEFDLDESKITDLICIHNYDYDGYMTEDRLLSLLAWFRC